MKISREPLRNDVRTILIDELVAGELEPGRRIVESQLAEQLGISRTPLREALVRLEEEGLVESNRGKGFIISPLRQEEATQLYQLIGRFERTALEWSPSVEPVLLDELEELNDRRTETSDPAELIELDKSWHEQVTGECRNEELLKIIDKLKLRLYRYEFAYTRERDWLEESLSEHREISQKLRDGDRAAAAERLEEHWLRGQEHVGHLAEKGWSEDGQE